MTDFNSVWRGEALSFHREEDKDRRGEFWVPMLAQMILFKELNHVNINCPRRRQEKRLISLIAGSYTHL